MIVTMKSPNASSSFRADARKAKAKFGAAYHATGGDGVHPDVNGHMVVAYAFLKALGCDREIGKITVDLVSIRPLPQMVTRCCHVLMESSNLKVRGIRYAFVATLRRRLPR